MKKTMPALDPSRRQFLGIATAGAAVGLGLAPLPAAAAPAAATAPAPAAASGYRETEHIRRYYQSAR